VPRLTPSISENSLRTVALRKPLADHLLEGCTTEIFPKTVINLLYSGGNLMGGASAPNDEFTLSRALRNTFPSLELLSGATDNFVLPGGCLRLVVWPVAREYVYALKYVKPDLVEEANCTSIFDLVTEETRTRGTGDESEGNQMLYTYEVLAAGVKFVVRFSLHPKASLLCQSALAFGLKYWDGFFGGQGRQGRGMMKIIEDDLPNGKEYSDYVDANREELVSFLKDGTLGSGKVLCQ
jgi:hypothetical protein